MKSISLPTIFIWSKKIHRWCMSLTVLLILVMASTGFFLDHKSLGGALNLNFSLVRYIHREVSSWFTIVLIVMMLTGLSMYFLPELIKKQNSSK